MRFHRAVSVVLLFLLGPTSVFRPAVVDALLIHAHDDLHAHVITLPDTRPPHDTHDDHDHTLLLPCSYEDVSEGVAGRESVVLFPKVLLRASSAAPIRLVASAPPIPPWLPLPFQNAPDNVHLLFATGPPIHAFHRPLGKTATLLLLNHALLL